LQFRLLAMAMTEDVAVEIMAGRHFSMPERVSLGLWPHPPIKYEWLVSALASGLSRTRFFPDEPGASRAGMAVRETFTVENVGNGFVGRASGASPLNPRVIERTIESRFPSAREAAKWYLQWQLGIAPDRLPARLDGWVVI
jgi:hypothetical protein